jgi:hypothetical protein
MTHRTREMALPALLVSGSLVLASVLVGCASQASQADTQPAAEVAPPSSSEPLQAAQSPDELNQLVAPIALYPDALSRRSSQPQAIPPKSWKQIGGSSKTRV